MTAAVTRSKGFLNSSIGLKAIMAASGLVYVGFVFVHMLGNLQIFLGAEAINVYAYNLHHTGPMLGKSGAVVWGARMFLLLCLALHVFTAVKLKKQNWQARPQKYAYNHTIQATIASRYMGFSGLVILVFIVYHLLHFTFMPERFAVAYTPTMEHTIHGTSVAMHNVYGMVVASFQWVPVAIFYIVAQVLLALHLSHAVASVIQTLGFDQESKRAKVQQISNAYALLILVGNASIPIAILTGLVK